MLREKRIEPEADEGWRLCESLFDARPQLDQLQTDRFQHPVEIMKRLVVGETEYGEALRRERGGSGGVARKLLDGRMRCAIHFDD